jgi:hypothetical protein
MIVKTLKSVVETGKPPLGTRVLYSLFALLEATTPAICKAENWPLEPARKA